MQIFVLRTLSHFKCVNEIEGETFWLVIPLTWLGWLYHSPGLVGYTTDLALLVIPQIWTVDTGQVSYTTDLAWLVDPLFSGLDKTDLTNS